MKHLTLNGSLRTVGKKADVKAVRRNEQVPCVLYGAGIENVAFSIDAKDLKALTHTPYSHIVDLNVDGKAYVAKLQAIQYHPVTDEARHVDFLVLDPGKPVTIEVPVKIFGNSVGVRQGGKLYQAVRKLRISGLIDNLPDELPVDITPLGVGKQISAGDLSFDNIQIVSPKATLVCAIKATRAAATATTEEAAAPAAE